MTENNERTISVGRLFFLVVEVLATFLCGYYVVRLDGLAKEVTAIELTFTKMSERIEQVQSLVGRLDDQVSELSKRIESIDRRVTVMESK